MVAVISDNGGATIGFRIHDIFIYELPSAYDTGIDLLGTGSDGIIENVEIANGTIATGIAVQAGGSGTQIIVRDSKLNLTETSATGIEVFSGDVYVTGNVIENADIGIKGGNTTALGHNVFVGVTTPFQADDVDVVNMVVENAQEAVWKFPGTVATSTGVDRFYFNVRAFIISATIAVDTAGTGTGFILADVNLNGTTIHTDQNLRPTLAAAENFSGMAGATVRDAAAGDYLTVDIDAVTATTPGDDATVTVRYVELDAL